MARYGIPEGVDLRMDVQVDLMRGMNAGVSMYGDPTAGIRAAAMNNIGAFALPALGIDAVTGGTIYPPNFTEGLYNAVATSITDVGAAVTHLGEHTADHINNIAGRLGLIEGAAGVNATLNQPNDPCGITDSLFGSILGAGIEAVQTVVDLIADLQNVVNALVNAVGTAVAAAVAAVNMALNMVNAAIAGIINMINAELAAMADWINKMINQAVASMFTLFGDYEACAKAIVRTIASPAGIAILNQLL